MNAVTRMIAPAERTIGQLCLSPNNCRTHEPSAEDTAPLEALILTEGLRNPIEVHAMRGGGGKSGAFAGRRRYYAIKRLIARGALPADWPIKVTLYSGFSDAELIEKSISENFRQDLSDTELFAGIARAHAKGHDVERIARNLGDQDVQTVAGWLRLGTLADPIFAALVAGEIDVQRAKAYAATEDRALQADVFAKLCRPEGLVHPIPAEIRRALKVGDRELGRHLLFVGEDAYRAAGGRYELDLFPEDGETRGRVVDEGILFKLVGDRLTELRDQVRASAGHPQLRFERERPKNGIGGTDYTLEFKPKPAETPDGGIVLPESVVAHVAIGDDGTAEITYWWPTAAAKYGTARQAAPAKPGRRLSDIFGRPAEGAAISTSEMSGGGEARRAADTALRDEAGLTIDTIQILRSQRRMILRARMIDAVDGLGDDAADFLAWSQLRMLLVRGSVSTVGAAHLYGASGDPEVARDHIEAMPANAVWRQALYELQQQSFLTGEDLGDAFLDYCASGDRMKRLATAVVAGLALERSLDADGYRVAAHDALAFQLDLDDDQVLRRYWTPTAELLGRIPKEQRAAIAEPFVEAATVAGWPRLRDLQLTDNVLQVVTGIHPATRPACADAAADWVHPQLRFRPIGAADVDQQDQDLWEAAE